MKCLILYSNHLIKVSGSFFTFDLLLFASSTLIHNYLIVILTESPDAHHVVVPRPKTKSSTITEEAKASIHKAVERAKKKENDQTDWKNLPMKPKMIELKKRLDYI